MPATCSSERNHPPDKPGALFSSLLAIIECQDHGLPNVSHLGQTIAGIAHRSMGTTRTSTMRCGASLGESATRMSDYLCHRFACAARRSLVNLHVGFATYGGAEVCQTRRRNGLVRECLNVRHRRAHGPSQTAFGVSDRREQALASPRRRTTLRLVTIVNRDFDPKCARCAGKRRRNEKVPSEKHFRRRPGDVQSPDIPGKHWENGHFRGCGSRCGSN